MRILGIETSCDETAASLTEVLSPRAPFPRIRTWSNIISSQVKIHRPYGGVVPHLAAREHEKNLPIVLRRALTSRVSPQCDLIAVTMGPGLLPALVRGVRFAKELAQKWGVPLLGVDHMEGHLFSALLRERKSGKAREFDTRMRYPAIALLVSGGHTQLWLIRKTFDYKLLGETRDDAAGEAFDKVARLLGLSYPGGPEIAQLASRGNAEAIHFPRPMLNAKNYDFSYSGLKTAVLYYLREHPDTLKKNKADIAAAFELAAIEVLVVKTLKAVREFRAKTLLIGGGVAANELLRKMLSPEAKRLGVRVQFPPWGLAGDNALMIAVAGFFRYRKSGPSDPSVLDADPNHRLDR